MAELTLGSLPEEILLNIISFLDVPGIIALQSVSKNFLRITRDDHLWRIRCLETSAVREGALLFRRGANWVDEDGVLLSQGTSANGNPSGNHSVGESIRKIGLLSRKRREKEYLRIAANWDPTFPNEPTNWYHEYIQRHAPITTNWLERPVTRGSSVENPTEVRGVALHRPSMGQDQVFAVSPLDDGSICIWDVRGAQGRRGAILSVSKPALLWDVQDVSTVDIPNKSIDKGITECVSVDDHRHTAFFAVGTNLVEVDLEHQAIVARSAFDGMIKTMSTASPTVPLTVATAKSLYLHDYRDRHLPRGSGQVTVDPTPSNVSLFGRRDPTRLVADLRMTTASPASFVTQEGPHYIHHMEKPGCRDSLSDDIFVAGRFTSVLHYDRRMFPAPKGSLHSGGRLCSLTSLPYPFSSLDSALRRHLELSEDQVNRSKNVVGGRTLIACGEYNTKGSLEIYGLSSVEDDAGVQVSYNSATKNRQTASQSKLLSVINHGNRIAFSDGQGYVKWMERDGFTEVRRHKIGQVERTTEPSLFGETTGSDEIARKILSVHTNGDYRVPNDDDVLFWTGETLGLLRFTSEPGFSPEDFVDHIEKPEETAAQAAEQVYAKRMRHALERQADEVRFMQHLGAGLPPGGI
ncbi:F-box domain-containing protein [Xylariaceae sp. FL0594]|nr:F-box domain-containing protein [Xylariaceae sp. FL0594]